MYNPQSPLSLDEQWRHYAASRFITMPLAGTIMWVIIGIVGLLRPGYVAEMAVFVCTGSIFYLALGLAKFTGEDLLGKTKPGNFFDRIFLSSILMAFAVYSIAIPFYLVEKSSLPMTVGILTGLMWIPFSILARHWVGLFHAGVRTAGILVAWYSLPEYRFVAIPAVVVATYLVTIVVLEKRYRALQAASL
ncbi:DUF7010 family protein [Actomonas aquatica]|uniref:Uncharacterized protein n=1 Tax=Actomonas aquatica TaxID=2866162 RepID=A0ABZ1C2E0_9BACT|nr:hypothetical protein [Opitutus sp. WL0086]WRQ85591.1 hypothetical protein K1X11_012335 [Opitutus sp. WL0086]